MEVDLKIKPIENVFSAVWLAAAILTYQRFYYSEGLLTAQQLAFPQQEIQRMASKLCTKTVHSPRISQWCNGDHPNNTYNYLRKVGLQHRRITIPGEFQGAKEKPDNLAEGGTVVFIDLYADQPVTYAKLVAWILQELPIRLKELRP